MSYDQYLAICWPLHYPTLMHKTLCMGLAIGLWLSGFTMAAAFQGAMVSSLTFCGGNEIDHFFCDLKPLQKLSCTDPHLVNLVCMSLTALVTLAPFGLTLASYRRILSVVLHVPSTTGRQKAFSTCSSHLAVVTLFYGTLILLCPWLAKCQLYTKPSPCCIRLSLPCVILLSTISKAKMSRMPWGSWEFDPAMAASLTQQNWWQPEVKAFFPCSKKSQSDQDNTG